MIITMPMKSLELSTDPVFNKIRYKWRIVKCRSRVQGTTSRGYKLMGAHIFLTSGLFCAIHCRIQSSAGGYSWRYWGISRLTTKIKINTYYTEIPTKLVLAVWRKIVTFQSRLCTRHQQRSSTLLDQCVKGFSFTPIGKTLNPFFE